jgi:integrase
VAVITATVPVAVLKSSLDPGTRRHRRQALRKFLQVCGLQGESFEDLNERFDDALRLSGRRRGSRFVLAGGTKATPRPRPRPEDFEKLLAAAAAQRPKWLGARNRALLLLARDTGLRRHSLTGMCCEDFSLRPAGLFVSVRLKGRSGQQEREVPSGAKEALDRYIELYNETALKKGWHHRLGFGLVGPFWRTSTGKPLTSGDVLSMMVRKWAEAAGVDFTLHEARHLFSGMLSDRLGPDLAAEAGDWSAAVMRKHYSRPGGRWRPVEPVPRPPGPGDDDGSPRATQIEGGQADAVRSEG